LPNEYLLNSNLGDLTAEITKEGINTIVWNDKIIYDIVNNMGESAKAYILTDDDELMYQAWTMDNVKHSLVSPSTANFKYQWNFGINETTVTVQSGVDSQNAYGALIKNTFTAQFDHSTTNMLFFEISGHVIFGTPKP
jgi:hypothetical protein